ncbi:DUF4190 domain-containing protein [Streptomyces sp. NPDC048415]|uniref:DUF4190 domain-containing protein n=1 Tax=Streptomyces sp. NPDC048415 TaxID=3154822 RepID=UPI00343F0E43
MEDPAPGAGHRDAAGAEEGLPEAPPQDTARAGGPAPDPRAEQTAPSPQTSHVHLTKPPSEPRPTPNPWAPPVDTGSAGWSGGPTPPAPNEPTVPGVPGASAPNAGPWANPFAPPSSSGNPFAPPAARTPYPQPAPEEHVPPPPIAPDGPGRPAYPYDYPQYAPVPPQGPYQGGYGWPPMPSAPSNGMGTAGLVLGILAAVVFCLWPLAIVLGVLGVIFGVIGRRKARRGEASNPGQALAGIICGAVGIGLGIAMLVFLIVVPDDSGSGDSGGDDGFSTALVMEQP